MNVKTQIEKFNSDNLTSAIETCYAKPFYRVLIVAPKMVMLTGLIVVDCVSKLYPHERSEFKIRPDLITFPNGSLVKIINQNSTARGYRVHEILITDLSNKELIQVLEPMICDWEKQYDN